MNSRQPAKTMTNSIFALLDRQDSRSSPGSYFSAQLDLIIRFAAAIRSNVAADELIALFENIVNPGCYIYSQLISHIPINNIADNTQRSTLTTKFNIHVSRLNLASFSPAQKVNYAIILAKLDQMEEAESVVAKAYEQDANLADGYARIGWHRFVPQDMAYEKTVQWFEKDLQSGHLSGQWKLKYAQALAVIGSMDAAEELVAEAYKSNPNYINGFSGCAMRRYMVLIFNPAKALPLFERDRALGRMGGIYFSYHTAVLAALGDIDNATAMVKDAYAVDPQCKNGYSLAGWYFHVKLKQDYAHALEYFKLDEDVGRVDSKIKALLCGLHMLNGNRKSAELVIRICYAEDSNLLGAYTMAGFCDYTRNGDLQYLKLMIEKDRDADRLVLPYLLFLYAAVLLHSDNCSVAIDLVKSIIIRSELSPTYAKTWLKKYCLMDDASPGMTTRLLEQLLSVIKHE